MPTFLPFECDGFLLRELRSRDAPALADIEFDPGVKRFLSLPELSQEEWIKKFDASSYDGLAVEVEGQLAGRGSLLRYRAGRKGYAEIAVVIGRAWWGKGLGRRVAKALIEIAFFYKKAKGVVGVVHPEHQASIALLCDLGFRKRGVVQNPSKPGQSGHLIYRLPRTGN